MTRGSASTSPGSIGMSSSTTFIGRRSSSAIGWSRSGSRRRTPKGRQLLQDPPRARLVEHRQAHTPALASRSGLSAARSRIIGAASERLRLLRLALVDGFTPRNAALALLVAVPMAAQAIGLLPEVTVAAAVGASASTLLATNFLYGFDFGSYLWRGLGLYTQIWAMHLSFVALAGLWRLVRYGTGFRWTSVVLAVLVLSHLLYAYMMVV